jgi:lysyl-tRNA synthetase class 2
MSGIDDIRAERLKKVEILRKAGMDPYPAVSGRSEDNATFLKNFETHKTATDSVTLAGRIMSLRGQGGIVFADLFDGSARVQSFIKKDEIGDEAFTLFQDAVDAGDFIEATGTAFTTNRGVNSLSATSWRMLSKSLRPVPTEWFGLKDEDERYRKRYLDFILNPASRELVLKRAKFWSAVRRFHEQHGFLEVQTPVLEVTTGGGDANPFGTHHNALDMDVYLRISAGELWQKRLMVAGFPKTFEMGRIFRNEGMSAEHAQDYEQCEGYWAYADFKKMYTFLKECYQFVAQETFGTQKFSIRGFDIDLGGEWSVVDYAEEIRRQTGIDIWTADEKVMRAKLAELKVSYEDGAGKERLIDTLWKHCRKSIGGPAILVNEPKAMSPLAKSSPTDVRVVERFHFIIAGSELGQGYSELNDPVDQRARFEEQQALRDKGDKEAQMADMEFVEALEYGMPPTAGHGFSERLFSFLAGVPIREGQLFPLMKPRADA